MNRRVFGTVGWVLLLIIGVSWISFGYSSWYLLLLALTSISFSINDGSIKKVGRLSLSQIGLILLVLVGSVGIVIGFIQLANYLITDVWHLRGRGKTILQVIAIIISLYPVKIVFASIVHKVYSKAEHS